MSLIQDFDRQKCINLFIGIAAIYILFVPLNVLFEWLTKLPYVHINSRRQQYFRSAQGLIGIERGIVWLLTQIWNRYTIPKQEVVKMPKKNLAICGFIIFFSSISYTEAIYLVSFPLTVMVKSCNILSVILVGVLCSRVQNKQLKLGPKKLLVAIIVTIGIVMFRFFDPEADFSEDGRKTQLIGLLLLIGSLLADGFLPDFQAQVKEKYKPAPTEMMLQINKWTFIFCFGYAILTGDILYIFNFAWYHPLFLVHILSMSVLAFVGQIFIYRMIKQFKQHIVPFVATTRKIVTVGFSLVYFNHKTVPGQIIGIILVFVITTYEFISEMKKDNLKETDKTLKSQHLPIQEVTQQTQLYEQTERLKGASRLFEK